VWDITCNCVGTMMYANQRASKCFYMSGNQPNKFKCLSKEDDYSSIQKIFYKKYRIIMLCYVVKSSEEDAVVPSRVGWKPLLKSFIILLYYFFL
jgi:hypothetical protein